LPSQAGGCLLQTPSAIFIDAAVDKSAFTENKGKEQASTCTAATLAIINHQSSIIRDNDDRSQISDLTTDTREGTRLGRPPLLGIEPETALLWP
jgi:hypothetical protein